jgi:hypothetical protein
VADCAGITAGPLTADVLWAFMASLGDLLLPTRDIYLLRERRGFTPETLRNSN